MPLVVVAVRPANVATPLLAVAVVLPARVAVEVAVTTLESPVAVLPPESRKVTTG